VSLPVGAHGLPCACDFCAHARAPPWQGASVLWPQRPAQSVPRALPPGYCPGWKVPLPIPTRQRGRELVLAYASGSAKTIFRAQVIRIGDRNDSRASHPRWKGALAKPNHPAPDGEAFREKVVTIAAPQVLADASVDVSDAPNAPTRTCLGGADLRAPRTSTCARMSMCPEVCKVVGPFANAGPTISARGVDSGTRRESCTSVIQSPNAFVDKQPALTPLPGGKPR
jgi:hypothetical protein